MDFKSIVVYLCRFNFNKFRKTIQVMFVKNRDLLYLHLLQVVFNLYYKSTT